MASACPRWTANRNAVNVGRRLVPGLTPAARENEPAPAAAGAGSPVRASRSAPPASSTGITAALPSAAAHISAVWLRVRSLALGSAPFASRAFTTSGRPVRAAVISTVSPLGRAAFGSAPAASRRITTSTLPLVLANDSGVTPYRFAVLAFAPASRSAATTSTLSRWAAQWSAVDPSVAVRFGSTRWPINRCTAARSPFFAASISALSPAPSSRTTAPASTSTVVRCFTFMAITVARVARVARRYRFASRPVLSPTRCMGTPTLSSTVSPRFIIGVSMAYCTCRPPSSWPHAPPASTVGMFTGV